MTIYRHEKKSLPGTVAESTFTRDLMWCAEHQEPAWLYDDGSVACWWESIVEQHDENHVLIELDRADDLTAVSDVPAGHNEGGD